MVDETLILRKLFDHVRDAGEGLNSFIQRYMLKLPDNFMKWSPLSRAQYIEIRTFLSDYLLSSQGDRMAMANSVEGRAIPFGSPGDRIRIYSTA
jgi:asparagine synthase (glutamine-hydrolysing)